MTAIYYCLFTAVCIILYIFKNTIINFVFKLCSKRRTSDIELIRKPINDVIDDLSVKGLITYNIIENEEYSKLIFAIESLAKN